MKKVKKFDMQSACRGEAETVLDKLKEIAYSPSSRRVAVRVQALNAILDRGYGKPKETITNVQSPRIIEIIRPTAKPVSKLGVGVGKDIAPKIITPQIGNSDNLAEEEGTAH